MWLTIVTNILSSIVFSFCLEPVVNKARNSVAKKLKDGDIANETWREKIIEDLEDIKKKIDGLSRKDLLASYRFFKEGVVTLNLALDEANGAQNGGSNTTTATTTRSESESGVLNEAIALTQAIQKLSHTSNGRLRRIEKYFRAACEKATEAFCNEALSLPDRIMAAQLRVISKILECLQDTKTAVAGCILFLEELHNLPAIEETFSTYFKGGLKSRFYKDSRLENVKSVLSLNFAISEFVARFSGELPDVRNWPRIHVTTKGETIHPLLIDIHVVKEIFDKEEFQMPESHVISSKLIHRPVCMNSEGQILFPTSADWPNGINILKSSGDIETFCQLRKATANPIGNLESSQHAAPLNFSSLYRANLIPGLLNYILGQQQAARCERGLQSLSPLAIDRHDNVFVIVMFEDCTSKKNVSVLFLFDSSGNERCERVLDFLECHAWKCVINNDGDIIIQDIQENLYVCDSNGKLKSRLSIPAMNPELWCITDQNEIVVHTLFDVFVYTKEGNLKRTILVKKPIESVTFNYVTSKIEVLVKNLESVLRWPSYSILSYSKNDEVECLYLPVERHSRWSRFLLHPAGPAALVFDINFKTWRVVFM